MNENLNLAQILKRCPKGTKLYSLIHGDVEFYAIDKRSSVCPIILKCGEDLVSYSVSGKYIPGYRGECILFPSKEQRDWSKFTAPWCNLEKQGKQILSQTNEQRSADKIEPKFKVGNWYQCTKDFFGKGVTFDKNTAYYCAQEGCLQDEYGCHIAIVKDLYDNFKLWTIQDAKDGDILAISWWEDKDIWEKIIIFKKYHSDGVKGVYSTPCVEGCGNTFQNGELVFKEEVLFYSRTWTCNLHPATKEQRDTLMKAMDDAGYKWNMEKKKLNKKEKFNPKTLKPFDKVLVRDSCAYSWRCALYSHTKENGDRFKYVTGWGAYEFCIPYNDDTKHLVGTTKEAPEYYRFWED